MPHKAYGAANQEGADVIGTGQAPIQGAKKGKSSKDQDQLAQMMADLVTSLQSKLIMNAEREFWATWYQRLVNNKEDGAMKQATITDILGTTFHDIGLDDIKTKYPPRVIITSAKEAEYKEMLERREIAPCIHMPHKAYGAAYMELQILKFVSAVNHREVFAPLHLPTRHDGRCRRLKEHQIVIDST